MAKNLGERVQRSEPVNACYTPRAEGESATWSSGVKRSEEVDLEARLFTIFINKKTQPRTKNQGHYSDWY